MVANLSDNSVLAAGSEKRKPTILYLLRTSPLVIMLVAIMFALVSCGSDQGTGEEGSSPASESVEATLQEEPAGAVYKIGDTPEGIVADPETGLVAVGFRNPDKLALIDGSSGEVIQNVDLPGSPRHLQLAAPGGPVLVPAESDDALVQVDLLKGEITSETSVGTSPHDAASAPNGRIFVSNEFGDNVSVIEGDREVEKIEDISQPEGVATTNDGLVGIVSVQELALEVFDTSTLNSLGKVDAGEGPTHVVADLQDHFYVTDTSGDAILVYEARPEPKQIDSVSLSGSPYGIAIDTVHGNLWVTTEDQVIQFALEGGKLRELARYPAVDEPNTIAVDTASGRVFVAGKENGELQVLITQ